MYNLSKFEMIKQQLTDLQTEILSLDIQGKQVPELIEKTNVLRENELLKKLIEKQSLLVEFYKSYIEILEELLSKFNTSKPKPKPRKATKTKKIQKTRSTKKKIVKRKPIKRKNSSKRKTKKKRKSR